MEFGASSNIRPGKVKKSDKSRSVWNSSEEEVLIQSLKDGMKGGFKSENGFRAGHLVFLEEAMRKVFPNTDLRSNHHINSKIHVWKKTYGTLVTMLSRSGVGWNETEKTIDATDEAWDVFVKSDNNSCTMRYKSWPYFNEWCEIFGNDRATGERSVGFTAAVQAVLNMSTNPPLQIDPPKMDTIMENMLHGI
ncbi:uncharacterized protein [Primulina eburnea]|uniref:uncharacterized protein n=1 Tax=Primulina eburnea TaxID=1245227 RepID=UPI003C6CB612